MTNTRIILFGDVNNYLEVSEEVVVPINFAIADIRDVQAKSGSYSKSIKIVGTKHNNEVLNNLFDVNTITLTYNLNTKQECAIEQNGDIILDNAILQLVDVEKVSNGMNDDEQVIYTVIVKDTVGDLFTSIGNAMLTDLDFSDLNHIYEAQTVKDSWAHDVTDGYKYILPMSSDNIYQLVEMKPAIYLQTYFDRIFANAGYQYEFDEAVGIGFDKLLIPYNGDKVTLTDTYLEEIQVVADNNTPTIYSLSPSSNKIVIDNEIQDPYGSYNPATSTYTSPYAFNVPNALECRFTVDYEVYLNNTNAFDLECIISGGYKPSIRIDAPIDNSVAFSPLITYSQTQILPSGNNLIGSGSSVVSGSVSTINIGNAVEFRFSTTAQSSPTWTPVGGGGGSFFYIPILTVKINSIKVEIRPSADTMAYSFPVIMNQYVPVQIKQSDFVKSVFTMFNVFCQPDATDTNKIILKTRDAYYDSGTVKDWSRKLVKDKPHTISFLPELTAKTLTLSYGQDKDVLNTGYLQNVAEVYGQVKYVFDNEYIKNDEKKSLIFGATPFVDTTFGAVVMGINGIEPKTLPRVVYDSGNYTCGTFYIYDYGTTGVSCNEYPYTTHFDKPINPDLDFNFGICDYYFSESYQNTTLNNLSTLYWRRTMAQINSGKLYTVYLDLTSADISQLKLNDKIYLDRSYWNINKVIDYNANSNEHTKVELLSIDDELVLPKIKTRPNNNVSTASSTIKNDVSAVISAINTSLTINHSSGDVTILGKGNFILPEVRSAIVIGDNQVVTKNGITSNTGNVNENFANTDLTLTSTRTHSLNGNMFTIVDDPLIASPSGFALSPTAGGFEYKSGATSNILQVSNVDFLLDCANGNQMVLNSVGGIQVASAIFSFISLPTFADDISAGIGGVFTNEIYKTPTGELRIKL